jgi:hypothetical protein
LYQMSTKITPVSRPKKAGFGLLAFLLIVSGLSAISVIVPAKASAATVTATGTNASFCDQTVDVSTGVIAERLANGDCLVRFTSASTINWSVPAGVRAADVLVVGGGGGGGGDGGSGGGGGALQYATRYSLSGITTLTISLGAGGAGGSWSGGVAGSAGGSTFVRNASSTLFEAKGGSGGLGWTVQTAISGGTTGTGGSFTAGQNGGLGPTNCSADTDGTGTFSYGSSPSGTAPSNSITGNSISYGGGGGGGSGYNLFNQGSAKFGVAGGGTNSGGRGANYKIGLDGTTTISGASNGYNGTANTGGGGGGSSACDAFIANSVPNESQWNAANGVTQRTAGGAGGSGVVIIKYSPITNIDYTLTFTRASNMYGNTDLTTAPLQNLSTYTVETWAKPTATCISSGVRCDVILRAGDYLLTIKDGTFQYIIYYDGLDTNWVNSGIRAVAGAWVHLALSRAGTSSVFYVNGFSSKTFTVASAAASTFANYAFMIGAYPGTTTENFDGQIDEVKLWNTARTQAQISQFMHAAPTLTDANLLAYYDFNEGSGSAVYNQKSGAATTSDLTLSNSPTFSDVKTHAISDSNIVTTFPRSYINAAGGWAIPSGVTSLNALVVGGGGAGGSRAGGGGGAGGYVYATGVSVTPSAVEAITVGVGGIGLAEAKGTNGTNSALGTKRIALGGGGGGGALGEDEILRSGSNGGSGGASSGNARGVATVGESTQSFTYGYGVGFAGGRSPTGGFYWPSAGGGGAAGAGRTPAEMNANGKVAGKGGGGITDPIAGTTTCYATGGGGGVGYQNLYTDGTAGAGGDCGGSASPSGGAGTVGDVVGGRGLANTGAGGGGSGWNDNNSAAFSATGNVAGGDGGSGVVIVSYVAVSGTVAITGTQTLSSLQTASTSAVTAIGSPTVAYQWQISADNSTFSNGETTQTFTPTTSAHAYLKVTVSYTFSSPSGTISLTSAVSGPYFAACTTPTPAVDGVVTYQAFKTTGSACNWTPPAGVSAIDLLVVAGGGAGGSRHAGGGGAGGLINATNLSINGGVLSIVVGAGGSGGTNPAASGANGSNSVVSGSGITERTAIGGGGGSYSTNADNSGGSGGGGGSSSARGGATAGQGNIGSLGSTNDTNYWVGGGGGGAGAEATAANATTRVAGIGGAGAQVSWIPTSVQPTLGVGVISGSSVFFAGGGALLNGPGILKVLHGQAAEAVGHGQFVR